MDQHLTDDQLKAYREQRLRAGELHAASEHIARCPHCQQRTVAPAAEIVASWERLHAALSGEQHLDYSDFAAYADGVASLEDKDRIEAHARTCADCASEIAAYQDLRRQIDNAGHSAAAVDTLSFTDRLSRLFAGSVWRLGWAAAGAAACVTLVVWLQDRDDPASAPIVARDEQRREPENKAAEVATLRDGGRVIGLDTSGAVSGIEDIPPEWRRQVEAAIVNGRLESRVYPELRLRTGTLLGEDAAGKPSFTLSGPIGVVVESATPQFSWKGESGSEYRVEVYDENFQPVAASDWVRSNDWRPAVALPRGRSYVWQLTLRRQGTEIKIPAPPAPEARFRILNERDARDLAEARRLYPDFRLLHAVLYARTGMTAESRSELMRLQAENPASETLKQLTGSLDSRNSRQRRVPIVTNPAQ